ncbi:UDP-glucose 6-dehydrogenase TuaD [Paenibacillus sp. J45TS6]|uniref:UDP-glucose dehydrogenase family protein n=1 Tax=unclassified Paenibacillus TaxID=185978 RepID=UPI001B07128C|nr:UDP-glucose/GDP-mannose dehydrogenase family protein [Paenibacillus sp. J45TS6]GIP44134.1 UDP-glucose 6-dehydrogenase TuaD [Paenibacillus sp. J45TS6]
MKIAVIGTGYVGLVSGVCFSEIGNEVICVDNNPLKVEMLEKGEVPIYEPGLDELIIKNKAAGRLSFTFDVTSAVQSSDLVILAVGTPPLPSGEADLSYIKQAAIDVAKAMDGYKIIATKSTVPVGTNEYVASIIKSNSHYPFSVASLPEFLREGSAIYDTLNPNRIVIGSNDYETQRTLVELHLPLTTNIITTDLRSAEMIKYASNAFLATKISFINEIANICEKVGADVTRVAEGMGYDQRIGSSFLQAGIGYGGSCFPKDTEALIQIAENVDYEFRLLKSVVEVNKDQRFNIIRKLEMALGSLKNKNIAIWGLAFKPNTDDIRDAPAHSIIQELIKLGANVKAYDPIATANFQKELNHESISWCETALEAAKDSDALCLLTEWSEFAEIDLFDLASTMAHPVLIDGRNVYDPEKVKDASFTYYSVGRPHTANTYTEAMS